MSAVKRALLSCHDKTGLEAFAEGLHNLGVELIASGGTATLLRQSHLSVKTVEEFAGISEQLDGRVKTLHPRIHAGILAKRDDPAHVQAVGPQGLIDLVVVNLYPFQQTVQRTGVSLEEALEQIDIGGVALLRAAAKNFPGVAVVSSPTQYPQVLEELTRHRGGLSETLRRQLATTAFALTSEYDQWIAAFLSEAPAGGLPDLLALSARKQQALRYGENAHQRAAWYVPSSGTPTGLAALEQLQGKELSLNNLLDLDAAVWCMSEFVQPTCVIVKHASPCGAASAATIHEAYQRALAADAESAFGGIVGLNRALDVATASQMASVFLEVIAVPEIEASALAILAKKPNLRVVRVAMPPAPRVLEWRSWLGGWLAQEPDAITLDPSAMRVVTTRHPTDAEHRDLTFAWIVAKHVKSNAIVLAKQQATVGIGQGQPSRVRAVRLAIQNAQDQARGAVVASDGFFPFPDSVELVAHAGVTAIIQPGGSVKDPDVIAAADRAGLAMVLTGTRHFRH